MAKTMKELLAFAAVIIPIFVLMGVFVCIMVRRGPKVSKPAVRDTNIWLVRGVHDASDPDAPEDYRGSPRFWRIAGWIILVAVVLTLGRMLTTGEPPPPKFGYD
jgi:hypothetical protein